LQLDAAVKIQWLIQEAGPFQIKHSGRKATSELPELAIQKRFHFFGWINGSVCDVKLLQ